MYWYNLREPFFAAIEMLG